jgi:hypothetical protein
METFIPMKQHIFSSLVEEMSLVFADMAHLSFCFIMLEVFSFEMFLQWSTEIEIARHKVWSEWWMGKTFPTACREVRWHFGAHTVLLFFRP